MGTDTTTATCPKCGNEEMIQVVGDHWGLVDADAVCLECGFEFTTIEHQMNLEEVNALRVARDLPPLERLAGQPFGDESRDVNQARPSMDGRRDDQ
jgi:transcription elongation factor Elf1